MKKTAIVTGGSRGIGFGIARQLAEDGFNIAILDVNAQADYQQNFDQLTALGAEWLYYRGSTASREDREGFVNAVVERFGDIDVLVNNAGVSPLKRMDVLETTEESYDRVMEINTKAPLFLTQLVANQMLKQPVKGKRRGVIVFITSANVTVASTNRVEYCCSKAALSAQVGVFAVRLASEDIQVYEVRPGVVKTDLTAAAHEKYDRMIEAGDFPIARWGTPKDIGNAVSAFCSDKFIYTTGNYIDVDGGFHIPTM